jgi:phage tail-like protein
MAEFYVNPTRSDPYKNFKFRIKWEGRYVAGVSKISGLRRTTEVIQHREGGDPNSSRKSPGHTEFAPITLERGVTTIRSLRTGLTKSGLLLPAAARKFL